MRFLDKALKIGEEIQDPHVISYASCWMAFSYWELGLLTEAEAFAEKALSMARFLPNDQYLSYKPFTALSLIHFFKGYGQKTLAAAKQLLDHGEKYENIRITVMGHVGFGFGHVSSGNFSLAIKSFQRAIETTEDPLYKNWSLMGLSLGYAEAQKFELAKEVANEVIEYSNKMGTEQLGTYSAVPQSVALVTEGHMTQGLKQLKELSQALWVGKRKTLHAITEHTLGSIYLQMVLGEGELSLAVMVKNIGFLIKNVPFAAKKAEGHFNKAMETARKMGMIGVLGRTYLDLGILHRAKRRTEKARECLTQAIQCFEECEAETFLKKAKEVSASLG
jgi:tetratricopeptide (TPR) repeat protein